MPASFSWRRFCALARKEIYQMIRDPSTILIAFAMPTLLLVLFGYGVNFDANRVRLGIVNEDSGAESAHFFAVLEGTQFVTTRHALTFESSSVDLKAGHLDGIIIIPADFSRNMAQNTRSYIQVITDASQPNTANFTLAYIESLWQIYLQNRLGDHAIQLSPEMINITPRYWYNPNTKSRNSLLAGAIPIIMTSIAALLTSLIVAREWERGTMEGLLSTPATRTEFLLAKIMPYLGLSMLIMTLCMIVTILFMGVPFYGSYLLLFIFTAIFSLSALGLGLLISTVTKNQFNASQSSLFTAFLPAVMLSGFIFEVSSMPSILRQLTAIIPARYFVTTLQTLFMTENIPLLLLKNFIALILLAIFWLGLTVIKTKNRLD